MRSVIDFVSLKIISPFNWTRIKFLLTGRSYDLTSMDRESLREMCDTGVYIWVTRRETHLTTYLITFSDYLLAVLAYYRGGRVGPKPKLGYYSHAFLNADKNTFIEAVARGVLQSYFDDVFNVDAVAALAPSGLSLIEWRMYSKKFVEVAKQRVGNTKYDTVFNLNDETELSCIELIRVALRHCMTDADYSLRFKRFEQMIIERKNLTPDMIRNCPDFEVVLEMRR